MSRRQKKTSLIDRWSYPHSHAIARYTGPVCGTSKTEEGTMDTQTLNPLTERSITEAVSAQRDEAVTLLCELVSVPSLLGAEKPAQDLMRREFERNGLRVHEFAIDEQKIRNHPGYSPSIISYEGRHNIVGIHQPLGPVRGKSLILNGHIDVVPVGAERLWTHPPFEPW